MKLRQIVLPGRPANRAPSAGKKMEMTIKALGGGYEIAIYGEIGCEDGDTMAALSFRQLLAEAGGQPVTVLINSDGGDVFEGLAIYNEMLAYAGDITVKVMGVAASAASIIAMGANRIEMAPNAQMMIHEAWVGMCGNKGELRDMADTLEGIDAALLSTYAARTGQPEDVIKPLLEAETYMSAQKCIELGFADGMIEVRPVVRNGSVAKLKLDAAGRQKLARQRIAALAAKSQTRVA